VLPGPPAAFDERVLDHATQLAGRRDYQRLLDEKRMARAADDQRKPLDAYRAEELAEMSRDIFDDRRGFTAARHAFVTKQKPDVTPARLARHRPAPASQRGDVALFAS
jgi:putative two-component system hydrogenase maturation factor HypX/HoxX